MEDVESYTPKAWEPLNEEKIQEIWGILRLRVHPDVAICRDCTGILGIEGIGMQHIIIHGEGIFRPVLFVCCHHCCKVVQYNATLLGIV